MTNQDSAPKVLTWKKKKVYRCRLCAFDTLDKATFEDHFRRAHPPFQVIEGRTADEPDDTPDEAPDLHTMTHDELNRYAGTAVTNAESFANKADLIAAIEAAQKDGK